MTEPRRTFLVECYLPGVAEADVAADGDRMREAVAGLRSEGRRISYLGALFVAADEAAFHQVRASDADVVLEASRRAGLRFERVVESVGVGSS